MFISEFSKFHHIDYLRILTSIRTMRDETKDKLIHNSLFSSEFSKFHPWIIRPYISTSIHSFYNLSIKQRIRKVDSLISYFSEFSNFRSFFFFNFKSMKKKRTNSNLFHSSQFSKFHHYWTTTRLYLFQQTCILRRSRDKEWPKSILFDFISLWIFQVSSPVSSPGF